MNLSEIFPQDIWDDQVKPIFQTKNVRVKIRPDISKGSVGPDSSFEKIQLKGP